MFKLLIVSRTISDGHFHSVICEFNSESEANLAVKNIEEQNNRNKQSNSAWDIIYEVTKLY